MTLRGDNSTLRCVPCMLSPAGFASTRVLVFQTRGYLARSCDFVFSQESLELYTGCKYRTGVRVSMVERGCFVPRWQTKDAALGAQHEVISAGGKLQMRSLGSFWSGVYLVCCLCLSFRAQRNPPRPRTGNKRFGTRAVYFMD